MNSTAILATLNTLLPWAIALYKQLRGDNPSVPALTDDQMIELLRTDSTAVVAKADAWLAAHPSTQ
jgi:hypothetical protein